MVNFIETDRSFVDFVTHPRQKLQELDSRFDKMMLMILSGGCACEPGMKFPMTEINPEIEESEAKKGKVIKLE